MAKAPDAFRTISEVSDWLDTPAHVLRFWESKFTQVKPIKRAGGRRYYRPEDMELLGGIKSLLHEQGMTIKGVQKLLREQGVKHVAALGPSLEGAAPGQDAEDAVIEGTTAQAAAAPDEDSAPANLSAPPQPKAGDTVERVDFRSVLASIPLHPPPRESAARPRMLALLARADRKAAGRQSWRIRPYLMQLESLRARMARE
jgi:DNA-binding transcriptional MerR regulator